jgi:tRNA A58 N-methylase Trm61
VQSFASYRVGEAHRWERAVAGALVRSFAYVGTTGEVTQWEGDPDEAELAIGLPRTMDLGTDVLIGEADVMRLANAWSVDPTTLDGKPATQPLRAAAARA